MKTRIKNIEECKKLFQVEIPNELVQAAAEEVYREIRKVAKIPGYRVGSAPQDLVEKYHSKEARDEILKRLIPEGYRRALQTHKVIPIGLPRVFNIDFESGKPLTFEAEVDVRPNFKLKNYKGIKVKKGRVSVSQKEIDEGLFRLRNMYAKYNDVTRPVAKGDYVVCDVEAFVEGKPITKKNENMWVLAEKDASLLGMGQELVNLIKGQTKEIEATLPGNFSDKKYAGKLAKFKIRVNGVKQKELPTLDDAFAKELNVKDLESLKKEIESQLFIRKENTLKINMENQILERLLKDNRFSPPASLVQRQKEALGKRLEMELLRKGMHKDEVDKKIKELDSTLEQDARNKIQIYFILDDIASKENIQVSQKDIDEKLKSIALSQGQSQEEVKNYYERENLLEGLGEEIKEEKVLEFLVKQGAITEEKGG